MNQNSYPNIHQPSSPATPPVEHMIHNPENLVCYYAPKPDHSHHPMKKWEETAVLVQRIYLFFSKVQCI